MMLTLCGIAIGILGENVELIYLYLSAPQLEEDGENSSIRVLVVPLYAKEFRIFGIDNEQAYSLARKYISIVLDKYSLATIDNQPVTINHFIPESLMEFMAKLDDDTDAT